MEDLQEDWRRSGDEVNVQDVSDLFDGPQVGFLLLLGVFNSVCGVGVEPERSRVCFDDYCHPSNRDCSHLCRLWCTVHPLDCGLFQLIFM